MGTVGCDRQSRECKTRSRSFRRKRGPAFNCPGEGHAAKECKHPRHPDANLVQWAASAVQVAGARALVPEADIPKVPDDEGFTRVKERPRPKLMTLADWCCKYRKAGLSHRERKMMGRDPDHNTFAALGDESEEEKAIVRRADQCAS